MPFPKVYPQDADDNLTHILDGTQPVDVGIVAESLYDLGGWVAGVMSGRNLIRGSAGPQGPALLSDALKGKLLDKLKALLAKLKPKP